MQFKSIKLHKIVFKVLLCNGWERVFDVFYLGIWLGLLSITSRKWRKKTKEAQTQWQAEYFGGKVLLNAKLFIQTDRKIVQFVCVFQSKKHLLNFRLDYKIIEKINAIRVIRVKCL